MTDIPNWTTASIRDLCRVNPKHEKTLADDEDVSFVPMAVVDDVYGELRSCEIKKASELRSGYAHMADGDVIFAKITPCMENGKCAVVSGLACGRGFGSTEFFVLRSEGAIMPAYLHAYLRQKSYRREARMAMTGVVGQARVPREFLESTEVPVPPLAEQKRIVAKIEELTARSRRAKEELDTIPALLDQLRQSILAAAFRGDLTADWRASHPNVEPAPALLERIRVERRERWGTSVPTSKNPYIVPLSAEQTTHPALPETWTWARAEEMCDLITKGTTPSSEKLSEGAGDVPFIKVYNLTFSGALDFSINPTFVTGEAHRGELARSRVRPGDVLMNIVGPPLGKVSVVPSSHPEWNINQAISFFRPLSGLHNFYLAAALLNPMTVKSTAARAKATSGQFNLTLEICRNIALPLAPLDEQLVISTRVWSAMDMIASLVGAFSDSRAQLDTLEQSILAKAFRGELVPQDPADEPASALLDRIRAARSVPTPKSPKPRRPRAAPPVPESPAEAPPPQSTPQLALPLAATPAPSPRAKPTPTPTLDDPTLATAIHEALWLRGPLEKDVAIRVVAEHLRAAGLVEFQRLRSGGPLHARIDVALEAGVAAGELDRPRFGYLRICKPDATQYTIEDWRAVLLASLGPESTEREAAIRDAAGWAREHLGLAFARLRSDGHIVEGLRSAINSAIRRGEVVRVDAKHIARASE